MEIIILMAALIYICASLVAVAQIISAGERIGVIKSSKVGLLWFIGIFAPLGFIAVGLYILVLATGVSVVNQSAASSIVEELPKL